MKLFGCISRMSTSTFIDSAYKEISLIKIKLNIAQIRWQYILDLHVQWQTSLQNVFS